MHLAFLFLSSERNTDRTIYHARDPNDIKLNFQAAKELGAKFVISKYPLNMADLSLVSEDCGKKKICLYRIN